MLHIINKSLHPKRNIGRTSEICQKQRNWRTPFKHEAAHRKGKRIQHLIIHMLHRLLESLRVRWHCFWRMLEEMGVPGQIINLIYNGIISPTGP